MTESYSCLLKETKLYQSLSKDEETVRLHILLSAILFGSKFLILCLSLAPGASLDEFIRSMSSNQVAAGTSRPDGVSEDQSLALAHYSS